MRKNGALFLKLILILVFVAALCHTNGFADEADKPAIATANVKTVKRSAPPETAAMPDMPMAQLAPPATLPAERLPQYRIGYHRADETLQSQVKEGVVRFVLVDRMIQQHIGRPLLMEATILIDGEPFSNHRDQLAAKYAKLPTEPATPEPDSPEPDKGAEEESADQQAELPTETETNPVTEAETETKAATVTEATEPPYSLTSESQTLLRRYAEAVGEPLEDSEAQWLMTHWTEGPSLLVLHPYFQSFRAEQRPAFVVLDIDRDGTLSQGEIDAATESFRRCDANRDEIVDVLEISKSADALSDKSKKIESAGPLFWLLSDLIGVTENDSVLYQTIAALDTNQNGQIEATEIEPLQKQKPDIGWRIEFHTESAESSKLYLIDVNKDENIALEAITTGERLNVIMGSLKIQLSAVQSPLMSSHSGQVSLGAVVDGYPLLPELDPNGDGQFTIREMRTLTQRLRERTGDDQSSLSQDECPSPIRVCIGLGPIVHEELANLRDSVPTSTIDKVVGPEWFVRMDRNQDSDLTRGEFPGTDEQFKALDVDADLLISASEANDFDKQSDAEK